MPIGVLLLERPVGRVVVLLLDEQRDRAVALDVVEEAGLPRGDEDDQREPREDEEGVHHPVGHHPFRLRALRRVVRERSAREREREERGEGDRGGQTPHCWPGTSGGISFCESGGSFSPRRAASVEARFSMSV